MVAGSLDRRIALQFNGAVVDQNYGGKAPADWITYATVWAQVVPAQGRERLSGGEIAGDATYRFVIRWRGDVTSQHRIMFENNAYDIVSPPVEVGRRDMLEILARLRQSPQR